MILYVIVGVISLLIIYRLFFIKAVKKLSLPGKREPSEEPFVEKKKYVFLITGAGGNVGRKLIDVLLDDENDFVDRIICMDLFVPPNGRKSDKITWLKVENFVFCGV